ncbi:MAG: hypothetical protein A2X82_20140 [Geobacteraceae bacterium GWC2_55_20]|nr:MAG: hypothetical protein A2X82_20140 [Geobacteraceae bacterium GWC2_55_20]OGU24444.1 MAG: hypothetical protein A2X85_09380 [Geobacteraceae bacterium GWF2_54_21]HCE68395.1 hypothetical protein [Geobacter sp.]
MKNDGSKGSDPNRFEVKQDVNLADIGTMLNEAIFASEEGDTDSVRDILFDIHSMIFPNAARLATPEENAAQNLQQHKRLNQAA